ncbi:aminopeptidase P family protein [Bradyrhizobium sp. 183]|uniref:M24 family metallopeptidase n=1 Tax=unclassified Bradyrhizobium TaxID=2631580 RepID=UPI001FFFC937|nr:MULTISPECIES: Xaa-Pro peptidase family protein [unclassified Bradyrhizobium]UPJ79367.1 aminopeptidase P family protein [Bradyrhizobium sp. 184]UPJ87161.1 aminopeptidase P family protein [Bradyrhizobium sp. 183]
MAFPSDEYHRRLSNTQSEMEKADIPVLLLHQPESIIYLTGFNIGTGFYSYHALAVPQKGNPVLVVRDVEIPAIKKGSPIKEWVTYQDTSNVIEVVVPAVRKALDKVGATGGKVGVDEHSWFLTPERYRYLRAQLPHAKLVAEPQIVEKLRFIKSPLEVECIRKAAATVESGVRKAIESVAAGRTERELAAILLHEIVSAGGEPPYSAVILSGERGNELHGTITDRTLVKGDQIYFEPSAIQNQYTARVMRTAIVGRPNADQMRTAEALIRIQDDGIAMMKPGAIAADIDDAFRKPVLQSGLKKTYTNKSGYSLGLIVRPNITEQGRDFLPDATWALQPGMVFHMLMMANGIGFSDTVLVTEKGPERLTKMERRLFWN